MKLALWLSFLLALAIAPLRTLHASESALDCETAANTLVAGLASTPEQSSALFLDALRTNPGCRRGLLRLAIQFAEDDPDALGRLLFIALQEFPADKSSFAELALTEVPHQSAVIRETFFVTPKPAPAAVSEPTVTLAAEHTPSAGPRPKPALVELPPEAAGLDDGIREAIARMSAKAEGKLWPEQHVSQEKIAYTQADEIRIPFESRHADESSLENGIPIDTYDERRIAPGKVIMNDNWRQSQSLRLDETKFSKRQDTRMAREARKREIAPAGAVGFPRRYPMPKSTVYYIPSGRDQFLSTIDLDFTERAPLIIRPQSTTQARSE